MRQPGTELFPIRASERMLRPTRRAVVAGLAALLALRPGRSEALVAGPGGFDLDPGGRTDSAAGIVQAIEEGARTGRTVVFPAGVYSYDSRHIALTGLGDVTVSCEPGVVFRDRGHMISNRDGETFQVPWGFAFRDCPGSIDWTGGVFESLGSTLRGSSAGSFDASNVHFRRPVLGFERCRGKVRLRGIGHRGNPGRGITGRDRQAVRAALGTDPPPNRYAALSGKGAFFFAYDCPDIRREDCYLVPDTCAREQVIFVGCSGGWRNERSWSEGQNMASLGKVIGCRDFELGGFKVRDTTRASIVDIIGENISFTDSDLECPNSKACDVSHEWGPANQPTRGIRIEGIRSTGRGVVNATVKSTEAEVAAAPITGLRIRDCRFNIGRTDFSDDVSMQLRGIIDVTIEAMTFENESPCGYGHQGEGGRSIRVRDCSMSWTLAADALDNNNRQLVASGVNVYERCSIDANASRADSGDGLSRLPLSGSDLGGRHVFRGGRITDTRLAIVGGAMVELHGVALSRASWRIEEGSLAFFDCTLDGQALPEGIVDPG
ncbi:hypothetical protein RUR49_10535 [Pseudoxanthobacter sp. M-2]|uniref:hypothetical protein n=1 Tax=Pseudoxanthobacter sp. M-2 TaxID=3078754 RepID=UPI0038FD2313